MLVFALCRVPLRRLKPWEVFVAWLLWSDERRPSSSQEAPGSHECGGSIYTLYCFFSCSHKDRAQDERLDLFVCSTFTVVPVCGQLGLPRYWLPVVLYMGAPHRRLEVPSSISNQSSDGREGGRGRPSIEKRWWWQRG
ncbi:unnamed protein product [Arctogadus glacialis]